MKLADRNTVENCTCKVVDINELNEIDSTAKNMNKLMNNNNGVGLAAPQVGIFKRFFILKDFQHNGFCLVINPEITWKCNKLESFKEGCLTYKTETTNPTCFVKRPKSIIAKWINKDGDIVTKNMKGLTAEVFQHEIEHLDGITIFNRS